MTDGVDSSFLKMPSNAVLCTQKWSGVVYVHTNNSMLKVHSATSTQLCGELERSKGTVTSAHTAAAVTWVISKVYQQMTRH